MKTKWDPSFLLDEPSQRHHAQAALGEVARKWVPADLLKELGRYGAGARLDQCPALAPVVSGTDERIEKLVSELCIQLASLPYGHAPFRHSQSGGVSVVQLGSANGATLSLVAYSNAADTIPETLCFADQERTETILAGSGRIRLLNIVDEKRGHAKFVTRERSIRRLDSLHFHGAKASKILLSHGKKPLVLLRLTRAPREPGLSREYRISDGALVHSASGSRIASQQLMYVETLGAMKRTDAAPVMVDMAQSGEEGKRWQALRHALVLNIEDGFKTLQKICNDPDDPLNENARVLQQNLIESYPQLEEIGTELCQE